MLRRDPSSIFRSVLLLSAVGTACGGAVETPIGGSAGGGATDPNDDAITTSSSSGGRRGTSSSTSSGGSTSSTSSTSSSGGSTSSGGSSSGGSTSSGGSSSGGSTSSSSGGNWTCESGQIAMEDAFCCAPGAACSGGGKTTIDGGAACQIDCQAVCAKAAPQVGAGFGEWCYDMGDGNVAYTCGACGVGRLPRGTKRCPEGTTLGERLARQAYYEAVSVVAFERLAAVLDAHGAPESLVLRARSAAREEARHAAIFRDLARDHGASMPAIEVRASGSATLFDLALENATEGCVRETLGAAITLHQAEHAGSEAVRAAYAAICDDEAEHAAFSWELRAWFDGELGEDERAIVARAHRSAVEAARADASATPDAMDLAFGLPPPERVRRMLDLSLAAMAA